jgi:transcriptional regulator with XRE-family HTH domain
MNTEKCIGTDVPKNSIDTKSLVRNCLSHNFKHIRKQKGFTQEEMSEQLGINRATYASYEEKRATAPLSVVIVMSNLTGIDMNILLTEELKEEVHND